MTVLSELSFALPPARLVVMTGQPLGCEEHGLTSDISKRGRLLPNGAVCKKSATKAEAKAGRAGGSIIGSAADQPS